MYTVCIWFWPTLMMCVSRMLMFMRQGTIRLDKMPQVCSMSFALSEVYRAKRGNC